MTCRPGTAMVPGRGVCLVSVRSKTDETLHDNDSSFNFNLACSAVDILTGSSRTTTSKTHRPVQCAPRFMYRCHPFYTSLRGARQRLKIYNLRSSLYLFIYLFILMARDEDEQVVIPNHEAHFPRFCWSISPSLNWFLNSKFPKRNLLLSLSVKN